ncbi:MAG: NAD-dependent epimerase/dehydratase family protein, partial [Candidatus Sulfotelmatobacter sp.]
MNSRILVSGVSGPVGAALLPSLRTNGCSVVRLVRGATKGDDQIGWDPAEPLAPQKVSGFDAVIHLAGESIFGRWTAAKKAKIRDSRVVGTFNLSSALAQAHDKPQVFVCGSAIGYYGNRGDEVLREESAPGAGFLAEVCQDWEEATTPAVRADIRTAHIRTGVVLSPKGGALGAMLPPFK